MLFLSITALSVSASSANGHGCAPRIPPAVPGTPVPAPAVPGTVVINEVLLMPSSTWHVSSAPTIDSSNSTPLPTPPTATSPPGGQNGTGGNSGRGHSNRGTSTWNNSNNSKAVVNGVQPQWSNIQLPIATTTLTNNTAPSTVAPSTSTSPNSNFADTARRSALTILFILLALVILWCWKVFYKKP